MKEKKENKSFKDLVFGSVLPKVELISITLIGVSVVFKVLKLQGANEFFMISMSAYAAVCYLSGFEETTLKGRFDKFIIKFGGIASAVLLIGVLFLVLNLPGAYEMFNIGVPTLIIAFIITLVKNLNDESGAYKKVVIRHLKTFVIITTIYLVKFYLVK